MRSTLLFPGLFQAAVSLPSALFHSRGMCKPLSQQSAAARQNTQGVVACCSRLAEPHRCSGNLKPWPPPPVSSASGYSLPCTLAFPSPGVLVLSGQISWSLGSYDSECRFSQNVRLGGTLREGGGRKATMKLWPSGQGSDVEQARPICSSSV